MTSVGNRVIEDQLRSNIKGITLEEIGPHFPITLQDGEVWRETDRHTDIDTQLICENGRRRGEASGS